MFTKLLIFNKIYWVACVVWLHGRLLAGTAWREWFPGPGPIRDLRPAEAESPLFLPEPPARLKPDDKDEIDPGTGRTRLEIFERQRHRISVIKIAQSQRLARISKILQAPVRDFRAPRTGGAVHAQCRTEIAYHRDPVVRKIEHHSEVGAWIGSSYRLDGECWNHGQNEKDRTRDRDGSNESSDGAEAIPQHGGWPVLCNCPSLRIFDLPAPVCKLRVQIS